MLNSFLLKKSKVLTINNQKYVIDEQIGEGAFGYVYKVHDINNSKLFYAIKKIICQSSEQLEEAQHEINLLTTIQHGNVLSLHMSCVQSNKSSSTSSSENMEVYLLLPLYQESLQNIIDTSSGYPECGLDRRDVQKIIFGCVNGIHAIHLAGYRHGDIKPANVLLDADRNPVITDFGSAEPLSTEITNRQQALSVQDRAATKTTASFRAPELFDTPSHCIIDGKSDVWALGCTYYAMLFSRTPFEAPVEGLSVLAVMSGNFSFPSSSTWPPEYHTMISACLRVDLEQRLSIEDLKILAGILPDPVDYLTLSSPSPSHKEVKHDGFGHSLMKKLTNKEPVPVSSDEISFEPNFSSFADFENFQKHATPSVRNKLDPAPQSLHKAAAASSSNHEEISSKVTEVVLQQEEDNEDEEWNFQSCEATLLVSDVPIESSAIQQGEEVIQNNEIPIPQLGHQESDDFDEEFGDFQAAGSLYNHYPFSNLILRKTS